MTIRRILAGFVLAAAFCAQAQASTVLNPSFETGDLTGWDDVSGLASVVESTVDALGGAPVGEDYLPTDGRYFVQLTAGTEVGAYALLRGLDFTVDTRSVLSLDAAFLAFDYLDYDDDGFVQVIGPPNGVLFASRVSAVGDFGRTPWTNVSRILEAGTYHLEIGVRNIGEPEGVADPTYASRILIDNVRLTAVSAAPEPDAWALMLGGFLMTGLAMRRGRARLAAASRR